jgi:cytochrome c peroxidase
VPSTRAKPSSRGAAIPEASADPPAGSSAAEQAQAPFLNPLEQALPDAACVVYRVRQARYGRL